MSLTVNGGDTILDLLSNHYGAEINQVAARYLGQNKKIFMLTPP